MVSFVNGEVSTEAVPYQQNAILDFDTGTLRRLPQLEEKIVSLANPLVAMQLGLICERN